MWSLVLRTIEGRKPTYGRHLQFQPRVRSGDRVESQNARPVAQATATTGDLHRNELSQLVSRLLGLRDADHSGVPMADGPLWNAFHNCSIATQTPTSLWKLSCLGAGGGLIRMCPCRSVSMRCGKRAALDRPGSSAQRLRLKAVCCAEGSN